MSFNCHYLVVFKSPREVNHLARHMFPGYVKYMQEAFEDARLSAAYEYFPRGDSVRLRQKSIKSVNHVTFLQLSMAQPLTKTLDFLRLLVKCTPAQRKTILKVADDALVRSICECILNVLKGTVPVSKPAKEKLLPHRSL